MLLVLAKQKIHYWWSAAIYFTAYQHNTCCDNSNHTSFSSQWCNRQWGLCAHIKVCTHWPPIQRYVATLKLVVTKETSAQIAFSGFRPLNFLPLKYLMSPLSRIVVRTNCWTSNNKPTMSLMQSLLKACVHACGRDFQECSNRPCSTPLCKFNALKVLSAQGVSLLTHTINICASHQFIEVSSIRFHCTHTQNCALCRHYLKLFCTHVAAEAEPVVALPCTRSHAYRVPCWTISGVFAQIPPVLVKPLQM